MYFISQDTKRELLLPTSQKVLTNGCLPFSAFSHWWLMPVATGIC
jgi:hypothetical protein